MAASGNTYCPYPMAVSIQACCAPTETISTNLDNSLIKKIRPEMLTAKTKYHLITLDLISNRANTTFGCRFTTISSVITTISN
jgi:hypothetical protein